MLYHQLLLWIWVTADSNPESYVMHDVSIMDMECMWQGRVFFKVEEKMFGGEAAIDFSFPAAYLSGSIL